jgi:hypothetical protein
VLLAGALECRDKILRAAELTILGTVLLTHTALATGFGSSCRSNGRAGRALPVLGGLIPGAALPAVLIAPSGAPGLTPFGAVLPLAPLGPGGGQLAGWIGVPCSAEARGLGAAAAVRKVLDHLAQLVAAVQPELRRAIYSASMGDEIEGNLDCC